jgi:hypothetical protein
MTTILKAPKTFEERLQYFEISYISFLKEIFTENFKLLHVWRGLGYGQNTRKKAK